MATTTIIPSAALGSPARFRKGEVTIVSLICLIAPVGAGIYLSPLRSWFVIALLMALYFLFLGRWISGRPLGVLVNERNLMSLSRFQIGTPLLLSAKANQTPAPNTVAKASEALNEPAAEIQTNNQGTLYSNAHISDASLTDMFQGDEIGNTAYVDVAKVQMFYFTVVVIVAYSYALYSAMSHIYPQEGFMMPVPPTALVGLVGN